MKSWNSLLHDESEEADKEIAIRTQAAKGRKVSPLHVINVTDIQKVEISVCMFSSKVTGITFLTLLLGYCT